MSQHECKQHPNCSNGHQANEIYTASEWNILDDVLEMVKNGSVVNVPASEPIVDFKFPEELKVSDFRRVLQITAYGW